MERNGTRFSNNLVTEIADDDDLIHDSLINKKLANELANLKCQVDNFGVEA